MAQNNFYNIV